MFEKLKKINVSPYLTTGADGLKYLNWAKAWEILMSVEPTASYKIITFNKEGVEMEGCLPFQQLCVDGKTVGFLVVTEVTIQDVTRRMWLPVMTTQTDNNGSMKQKCTTVIDADILNKNIMRCLVKNIAMFGLGLGVYTGEDCSCKNVTQVNQNTDVAEAEEQTLYSISLDEVLHHKLQSGEGALSKCKGHEIRHILLARKGIDKAEKILALYAKGANKADANACAIALSALKNGDLHWQQQYN